MCFIFVSVIYLNKQNKTIMKVTNTIAKNNEEFGVITPENSNARIVYTLTDEKDQVVYVGQTGDLKNRLRKHTSKSGRFHNQSVNINPVNIVATTKEAYLMETMLQKFYGLETIDFNKSSKGGKIGGKIGGLINGKKNVESGRWTKAQFIGRSVVKAKYSKNINAYYEENFIKSYPSIRAAANELGLNAGNISGVLHGDRIHTKNYTFKFV
jgi:predicted GIY-YIG superfamily endonuclease